MKMRNAQSVPLSGIPRLAIGEFRVEVLRAVREGGRLCAFFHHGGRLWAVLACDESGLLRLVSGEVQDSYAALTPECPQAHWFERELYEESGVRPEGHPWLRPIRSGYADFYRVEGDEVHEVSVGPVHAGVIEPGHFRFQCHGEDVLHLEIALGYQRRGAQAMIQGGPDRRTVHVMETLAGDTSIGHVLAYVHAVESLSGTRVPARALAWRGVALELERLANHCGDLGALANDVGYLPTASFCGRLRGYFLNMTALLCGSRFGRGLVRPGGVRFDAEPGRVEDLLRRLEAAARDSASAVGLLWKSNSVMGRFEETGKLSREDCLALGLVGPAARACGVERDVRHDFPHGIYSYAQVPVSTAQTGDVLGRAFVRWLEMQRSLAFAKEALEHLPAGSIAAAPAPCAPAWICVSLVEGWRGEVCHVALSDGAGRFARYQVVDASFHNWFGLAHVMRGQQISDFPLCNKSFNLSYCGHDL